MKEGKADPFALFTRLGAPNRLNPSVGIDQEQVRRDAERRERLGQLRAREHTGKRPNRVALFFS
jgi:hypothetical protein